MISMTTFTMDTRTLTPYELALRPGQYVPYDVISRGYRRYGHPSYPASQPEPYEIYDMTSSQRTPGASGTPDGPQTVEQLITHGGGYLSRSESDPATALMQDKVSTAWMGLDDIIHQVNQRFDVYHHNLLEIEHSKCAAYNELYECTFEQGGWPNEQQREMLQRRLHLLYAEQRGERTALWRDVWRLRQMVPETAGQYLAAARKFALLNDPSFNLDPGGDGL
ncbi:MAG: hypothetical protein D8M59_03775 [Planctomycetes bacterium]|nr:hypothetical protein [Planctomycetota bacterium]